MKLIFIQILLLIQVATFGQQNFCADSSYRVRYIFGNEGATLYSNPDTSGKIYFTGAFSEGTNRGLAVLKTTWGDSMIWARKIYMNGSSWNSYFAPDGSIICTGEWGGPISNQPELLICKFNPNGVVKWVKRYRLSQGHQYYKYGNLTKNLIITNDGIYVIAPFNNSQNIAAKFDLDGNILWSKAFTNTYTGFSGNQSPAFGNNKLYFLGNIPATNTIIITSLNAADGSISESFGYNVVPDPSVKAFLPEEIRFNKDNTLSFTGLMGIDLFGMTAASDIFFNVLMDNNLNPLNNYYYKNNVGFAYAELNFDLNTQQQKSILTTNASNNLEKYFISFDKNNQVSRTRKIVLPANFGTIFRNSLKLDDKQNIHFVYQYKQANKFVNEYARISNFSPTGTTGCVGKDTSILTRSPFTLIKQPYTWNNVQSNVLTANDVSYNEDTAIVTKELVCKIVSRCDSMHIKGPASICAGMPVRYTVSKNAGCFKNTDWIIDTSFATIINQEGDSAITLIFKKNTAGYIRAALTDCVVKDSFLVTPVIPGMQPLVNRKDSLLCPGKTLVLNASNGFTNYIWQGNVAAQQFTVSSAGVYRVTALDGCGIARTDSVKVTLADTTFTVPLTQTICLKDTAFINLPNDAVNISWQPAINSLLRNKMIVAFPTQNTLYTISAERSQNCAVSKTSAVVIKICPTTVFIPNSFTPNNDNRNDIFKPAISQPLPFYHLQIFNRYGQTVFETTDQQNGWNGMYKGSKQPMGGYIYQCSYRFAGGVQKMVKGYFILIR